MARSFLAIIGFLSVPFLSASLWAAELSSQPFPSDYEGLPIRAIEVQASGEITSDVVQKQCSLHPGDPLSTRSLRQCLSQFFPSEVFEDVRVDVERKDDGVRLLWIFIEKQRIRSIRVTGKKTFPDRIVLRVAGLKSGAEYYPDKLSEMETKLLAWYRHQGYFEAGVALSEEKTPSDRKVDLTLHIDEGPRAKVSRLLFDGAKVLTDKALSSLLQTRVGRAYDQEVLEEDVRVLRDYYIQKGYLRILIGPPLETYRPDRAEVEITLQIEAGPRVEIRFEGARKFSAERLTQELTFQEEKNFDDLVLEGSARRLREFYQKEGYYFANITYLRETPDPGHVLVVFRIDEGRPLAVGKITVDGSAFFTERKIKRSIQTEGGGIYLDESVDGDLETLRLLYQAAGFGETEVRYDKEFNSEKTAVFLHFHVVEGPRTFIGRIVVDGVHAFKDGEILSHLNSKVGQPYQVARARDDRYTIQSLYAQRGYLYTSVDFRKDLSFDGRYAILTYAIQEDRPVTVGSLYLEGNSFTKTHVILRELTIKTGDPFDYEKMLLDQRRIRRTRLFADVRLNPIRPEVKEYVKDLMLHVEEGRPGYVEFGVGYGDAERFRGSLEIGYRNLFGTAREVSARAEGSSIEQKYTLAYKEPWIFGISMDGRVSLVDLIEDKVSFRRRTLGSTIGVEKSFGEQIKASLFYQYEDVTVSDVLVGAILTEEDTGEGKVQVATINPSLVMDFRDDPFNPKAGSFYSITFRDAARVLGGKPQFVKLTFQGDWFYSPFSKVVLAAGWRGGMAERFGESESVPIFERFFVGGRSTVRGYDEEQLGVPGQTITFDGVKWTPTGGNVMTVFNGEVRVSLPLGLGVVFFVDNGNVWTEVKDFEPSELRSTYGGGLRYNTPVGPLRLDLGCKMDREVSEDLCVLHFTLGHAF